MRTKTTASRLARLARLEAALGEGPGRRLAWRLFHEPEGWSDEEYQELDGREQGWLLERFGDLAVERYGEKLRDLARYVTLPEVQTLWASLVEGERRYLRQCGCPPDEWEAARHAAMLMPFPMEAKDIPLEERATRMQAACGMGEGPPRSGTVGGKGA